MFPGLQTLLFLRESKQGDGSWNMEPLEKPPAADSSVLPPSCFPTGSFPFQKVTAYSALAAGAAFPRRKLGHWYLTLKAVSHQ